MKSPSTAFALALIVASSCGWAADGLVTTPDDTVWPQWQWRATLHSTALSPVLLTGTADTPPRTTRVSGALLGDYYIDAPGLRLPSGLGGVRASGGLLMGSYGLALHAGSAPADTTDAAMPMPYIGVGYTGLFAASGWGITADLGLVAENAWPGAGRTSRALLGVQGQDNSLRELRLSPLLQLGVSYSF